MERRWFKGIVSLIKLLLCSFGIVTLNNLLIGGFFGLTGLELPLWPFFVKIGLSIRMPNFREPLVLFFGERAGDCCYRVLPGGVHRSFVSIEISYLWIESFKFGGQSLRFDWQYSESSFSFLKPAYFAIIVRFGLFVT